MYAIIVTGGKQYRVQKGDVIYVEKLDAEADSNYTFDTVLAVGEEGNVKFGTPTVAGATVTGKVVKNGKGKKLTILTYRPKKDSKRKMGHRQPFTKIEITEINGSDRTPTLTTDDHQPQLAIHIKIILSRFYILPQRIA